MGRSKVSAVAAPGASGTAGKGATGGARQRRSRPAWVARYGSTLLGFPRFRGLVATLLLVACSQSQHSPPLDSDNSAGSSGAAGSGSSAGSREFQPVPRAQPTESGAWVVDPGDPLTLYALGDRSMRSRDGGRTWTDLAWPAGALSLAITQHPVPALYLRVSGPSGASSDRLFESPDAGDSWTDTQAVPPAADIVLVDGQSGPVLLALKDDRVLRSTDKGATWDAPVLPPVSADALLFKLGRLLVSSGPSPVVYVEATAFISDYESLVLVSTDAGATFVAKPVPSANPPSLSLDCHGRLYFSEGTSVYRSTDAAGSWESQAELEAETYNFRVLPGVPAACGESVLATGRVGPGAKLLQLDGSAVTSRDLPDEGELTDLGDDRLLSITFGLRQRSDDGGRTWWTAGVNLGLGDLVVSPTGTGSLFVSAGGGVYHSDDDGASWQGEPSLVGPRPQDVYPDPYDVNVLYARSIYGDDTPWSFVSADRGASFQNWPVPTAADPQVPEAIASRAPGALTVVTRKGVYATDDAGAHFAPLLSLPAPREIMWATIGSSDPPAIYTYVGGGDLAVNEVLASLDGGATWASGDPGTYVTNLVVDPADPKVVFALPGVSGDDDGVLRTLDGGLTWERIAVEGERYVSVYFDPQPPHALYAVGERLSRSEDHGSTWQAVTELPANQFDFELDPNAGGARYVLGERGLLYKMTE